MYHQFQIVLKTVKKCEEERYRVIYAVCPYDSLPSVLSLTVRSSVHPLWSVLETNSASRNVNKIFVLFTNENSNDMFLLHLG
jgi:hypothetical protein